MNTAIDTIKELIAKRPQLQEQIGSLAVTRPFKRGMHIDVTAEISHQAIFITRGTARLYFLQNGREHTFSIALEGEFVGVIHSLLNKPETLTRIEFLEPSTAIFIPMDKIHHLIKSTTPELYGTFSEAIIQALLSYVAILEEHLIIFQTYSAQERYRWFTSRYPKLKNRLTGTQIASLLGFTRETLYRIRSGKY